MRFRNSCARNPSRSFSAGLSTSVLKQIELKIELLDAYKTEPPNDLVKKNDVAFLTAVVYKF